MQTNILYGIGFDVSEVSEEKIIKFMLNHKDVLTFDEEKEFIELIEKDPDEAIDTIDEWSEEYECDNSGETSMYAVISNVMSRERGILFEYRNDDSSEEKAWIVLVEGMPWHFKGTLKDISEEEFNALLKAYMEELGIEGDPEEVRIEYFG